MDRKLWRLLIVATVSAMFLIGATLALAEEPPAKPAEAKKPAYVGSKACKVCHMGEKKGKMWEIWLESKHAKAMASLDSAKGETKDPKCLKCHVTGYGTGGYGEKGMEALAGADGLGAVGCEVCHGPGSEYKSMQVMKDHQASMAAGLLMPDAKTCLKCHNEESPTFKKDKPFKYEEMLAQIAHKRPPAEGTKP